MPRQNRAVLLLSSMHHKKEDDLLTLKTAMIADYNNTKGGMDELDKKCSIYSFGRRTRRWPLDIFYRIVDISGVNSFIIFQSSKDYDNSSRADFFKKTNGCTTFAKGCVDNQKPTRLLRDIIGNILGPEAAFSRVDPCWS